MCGRLEQGGVRLVQFREDVFHCNLADQGAAGTYAEQLAILVDCSHFFLIEEESAVDNVESAIGECCHKNFPPVLVTLRGTVFVPDLSYIYIIY